MQCDAHESDWRKQLKCAIRSRALPEVERRYPFFSTPYWQSLQRYKAIRLQTQPDARELEKSDLCADPFKERSRSRSVCRGSVQRFADRILVMVSDHCAMACRHCTRKNLLENATTVATDEELSLVIDFVKRHRRIRDVLLSGGDALMLSDAKLFRFVRAFAKLPQIDVVRVCTRMPCTLPMRVTQGLARGLAAAGQGKVWVNTQFNCAEELTPEAVTACVRLVDAGIPVSCQTVLLRGVNDSAAKMFKLCAALQRARVRPYYAFICDPVKGTGHFGIPLEKACAIEQALSRRIGGLAMPRFVADIPGAGRKVPLAELSAEKKEFEKQ